MYLRTYYPPSLYVIICSCTDTHTHTSAIRFEELAQHYEPTCSNSAEMLGHQHVKHC